MGFGEACINILLLTQGFLDPPVIYNRIHDKIESNPKIGHKLFMWRWYIGNWFITSVHIFSVVHLGLLLRRFDTHLASKAEKEEVFIYIFTVAITAQSIFTWITLEKGSGSIAGVEAQIFKAFNIKYLGWPNSSRRPDMFETIAYGMAIGFYLFPFPALVLPIIRDYDPINQMFQTFIPFSIFPIYQKIIVVFLYLWSVYFGAISCLNFLLLIMTHCYIMANIAKDNITLSITSLKDCSTIRESKFKNAMMTSSLTFREIQNLERAFHKRFMAYNEFRYMISGINLGLGWYIPASIGIGMSLCIVSNFGLIELRGRMPRIMETSWAVTTTGLSAHILHLMLYAAEPLTHSQELIGFWKGIKMGRFERRRVRGMVPAGLAMGQYFTIKRRTAMDIMDSILNYTISAIMGGL